MAETAQAGFTVGPWSTSPGGDRHALGEVRSPQGIIIAFVTNREGDEKAAANAHLIAAAPDLHDFATQFMVVANDVTARGASARPSVAQLNYLFDKASAALSKAEGRP